MEKLFEEALETIENLCEYYEARIRDSREGKEERKAKLRSLIGEIGDARTGDERFDTLAAIVREMVQEEDGEDYDDYDDDYDDDYEDYDEDYDEE